MCVDFGENNLYELYGEVYTPWEWQPKLKKIANDLGMDLFSIPFDHTAVDLLDIVKSVEAFIEEKQPEIIYTHFGENLNIDHQRVNQAVVTVCKPLPGSKLRTLLFFEVASSTEWQIYSSGNGFVPNWFVDISNVLKSEKRRALQEYANDAQMALCTFCCCFLKA